VTWPAEPVVAKAFVDQLQRNESISADMINELTSALDKSDAALKSGKSDKATADALKALADSVAKVDDAASAKRRTQLSNTMTDIAERLGD